MNCLLQGPIPLLHVRDQVNRCEVTHVPVRGGKRCVTELLLNDGDRHALHHQLVGVGVTEPMGVDALLNMSPASEAGHEGADVGGL